ncbi:MAG: S-layer homology domain-containing protein, partial [Tumebacillaceae bacterium]
RKKLKMAHALLLNVALLLGSSTVGAQAASSADQIYSWPTVLSKTVSEQAILTKGVTYQHIHYETASGPLEVFETMTDLSDPNVAVKTVMSGDKLENDSNETVSHMANRTGAVAGTNGDYFEMNTSGMALNMTVDNGNLIHHPTQSVVLGIDANNHVTMSKYTLAAGVQASNGTSYTIAALNGHPVSYKNGIVLMTPEIGYWEMASNATVVTLQKTDTDGVWKVLAIDAGKNVVECPYKDSVKLIAQGTAAISYVNGNIQKGDMINVNYGTTPSSSNLKYAIGGEVILLKDGQAYNDPNPPEDGFQNLNMPMTGLGVTQDGQHMMQVVVDGRSSRSLGLTYGMMTNYMKARGMYNAMIFDGGGSSELVVRNPGDTSVSVANNPSDGHERRVANGVFVYSTSAPGVPTYITINDNDAIEAFKGSTTKVSSYVRDENYNPLPSEKLTFSVEPSTLGTIAADGTFKASEGAGTGKIVATASNGVKAELPVTVFDTVDSLTISPKTTDLGNGETQAFGVTGKFRGNSITINPTYLKWSVSNASLGTVSNNGVFTAASGSVKGTVNVTGKIGNTSVTVTLGVGYVQKTVDDLTDSSKWVRSNRWGEVGNLSTSTAQTQGGKSASLAVNYSYPPSTDARQFVFYPKNTLLIPATSDNAAVNPIGVGLWMYGDNSGMKLLGSFADPNDPNGPDIHSTNTIQVNWTGWKYITLKIPSTAKFPVMLNYLDLFDDVPSVDTVSGHVYFSDLQTIYAARNYSEKLPGAIFDDIRDHWGRTYIEALANKSIVSGVDKTHFSPDTGLTRAQAVSLIARALNLAPQSATTFSDVPSGSWYAGSVGAAVKAGITNGVGGNKFDPNAPVDRNQAAVMIYNALKYKGKAPSGGKPIVFSDANQIKSWAKADIDALSAAGLMNGDGNGHLTPTSVTSRAQAAVMIYNMMKYSGLL